MGRPTKENEEAIAFLKEQRKAYIAQHYYSMEHRKTQREIARDLEVTAPYVSQLLSEIRYEARQAYIVPAQEAMENDLELLEESEVWFREVYYKSRNPVESITDYGTKGANGKFSADKSVRNRVIKPPEVRAAEGLLHVVDRRMKLRGMIDESVPMASSTQDGRSSSPPLAPEQRVQAFFDILDAMAARSHTSNAVEGEVVVDQSPGQTLAKQNAAPMQEQR